MFSNFTEETCTGTDGDLQLLGATDNRISFGGSFADGASVAYVVEDANGIHKCSGVGVYNSTSNTISRDDDWTFNGVVNEIPSQNLVLTSGTHTVRVDLTKSALASLENSGTAPTKNYIVDGDFKYWYEGTSQTGNGYASDTMWLNNHLVSSKVHSRQTFALGQTEVPGNPQYFSRTVVTTANTAGCATYKYQAMEDVTALAGETCTLSFWAKSDATRNMAIEFFQQFGLNGSPSEWRIGISTVNLTTSWEKHTVQVTLPSMDQKTIGTDGNDSLSMRMWFDAGSDFDSQTNSLGPQSGTFDIARVRLVKGTQDGDAIDEDDFESIQRVQRYFQRFGASPSGNGYHVIGMFTTVTPTLARCSFYTTPMRSSTTSFTVNGSVQALGQSFGTIQSWSNSIYESDIKSGQHLINAILTGGTVGNVAEIRFANDINGYFQFDARLV